MNRLTPQVIDGIEKHLSQFEQAECDVINRYAPGIYIRELHMKAGTLAIGKHQRFEHLNVLLKGKILMVNDDTSLTELVAPFIFVSKPGKKMGFVVEDVVWQNVYATTETDLDKLESIFIVSDEERLGTVDELQIGSGGLETELTDNIDYAELPYGGYKIRVAKLNETDKSVFATASIADGEVIASVRLSGKRTVIERYIKCSDTPNAEIVISDDSLLLKAIRNIGGCLGGSNGEEITISHGQFVIPAIQGDNHGVG